MKEYFGEQSKKLLFKAGLGGVSVAWCLRGFVS